MEAGLDNLPKPEWQRAMTDELDGVREHYGATDLTARPGSAS